jgi:hypothetical protein
MPIQRCGFSLPEDLGLEIYEACARQYGRQQSYERMVERGGFGLFECILVRYGIGPSHPDFQWRMERFLVRALAHH